jgi:hypothetical protein
MRSLYLPLIILWKLATGQLRARLVDVLGIALPPNLVKQVKYHFCPYLQKRSHARHIRAHATIAAAARNKQMKQFLIRYTLTNGTPDAWHDEIAKFISALNNDPDLKGQIGYRVMKTKDDSDYYHIASPTDDAAVKTLQGRDFFKLYNERTRAVAGGEVVVSPLELIAETAPE